MCRIVNVRTLLFNQDLPIEISDRALEIGDHALK